MATAVPPQNRFVYQLVTSFERGAAPFLCTVPVHSGSRRAPPWSKRTAIDAHELLRLIFFNYLTVRSGWEWELPLHPTPFRTNSIWGNFAAALDWLAQKRVIVDDLYDLVEPRNAQDVFQDLLHQRTESLAQVFDWSKL